MFKRWLELGMVWAVVAVVGRCLMCKSVSRTRAVATKRYVLLRKGERGRAQDI